MLLRELSTRVQRPLEFHRKRKYEEKKARSSPDSMLPARGFLEFHDFAVQTRYEGRFIRPARTVIANAS